MAMSATQTKPAGRRKARSIQRLLFEARSLVDSHHGLGRALGRVIRRVARQRMKATSREQFAAQIASLRRCRSFLESRSQRRSLDARLRHGIREYLACLSAWSAGAGLASCLGGLKPVEGYTVHADDLALWLQDDNVGCQTGLLRLDAGAVLFWHTEEDTIGYFDRPRLASFVVRGRAWHALVYPYLLPGPAFGWQRGWFQAVDSLHVRRRADDMGSLTCTASWLVWRLGAQLPARSILDALAPYVDGCAINVVDVDGAHVAAATHEFGRAYVQTRPLSRRAGSLLFQANAVAASQSRLAREEALDPLERARYGARGERTRRAVGRLLARGGVSPQQIVQLLASRQGDSYAYANSDVKAHCVGIATPGRMELYVAPGPACSSDRFQPQFLA